MTNGVPVGANQDENKVGAERANLSRAERGRWSEKSRNSKTVQNSSEKSRAVSGHLLHWYAKHRHPNASHLHLRLPVQDISKKYIYRACTVLRHKSIMYIDWHVYNCFTHKFYIDLADHTKDIRKLCVQCTPKARQDVRIKIWASIALNFKLRIQRQLPSI